LRFLLFYIHTLRQLRFLLAMFVNGPNPTKVQILPPHKRASSTPPLVLIHDGGGTTFSYFILGKLHREVWALHNPKYWDASKWDGGMDEMTRHYADLIKKAGLKGPIILGGRLLGSRRPDGSFPLQNCWLIHVSRLVPWWLPVAVHRPPPRR
jgi:hypothetical protein